MATSILNEYGKNIAHTLTLAYYNEHSFRTFLENLLNALKNDEKIYIIHEPKSESGQGHVRPDYKVYKRIDSENTLSYNALMGFIECKNWGEDLNVHIKGAQIDKYLSICPNILLTNYNRFILISFGNVIAQCTLFPYGLDSNLFSSTQDAMLLENLNHFKILLNDFFHARQVNIKSKSEVISILSSQSFYLALKCRESYKDSKRTSFHKFFEKTFETFSNITRYEFSQAEFCDILAQSVVYGLLVAHLESDSCVQNVANNAIHSTIEITQLESFVNLLPKEFALLSEFIYFAIPSFHIPESIAYALENIKKAIVLIDKAALATALNTHIESIAIYLYEDFLKAYDELRGSEKRKEGGVFYTPQSIVECIVSSIHRILKSDFGKDKGLAHKDVKVLDFATGTGSFLAKVFEIILSEEQSKVFKITNIKDKFLKDIYGFELSFVPYIVAHIKLSSILKNAGFSDFSDENKLQIFLTNTLDLSVNADYKMSMPLLLLEEQEQKARKIKHKEEVLVIMGNPPYNNKSKNNHPEILKLLQTYKVGLNETKINLDDDYIKFIRFAQWKLIERTDPDIKAQMPLFIEYQSGIMGFITNNSFVWGRTHRKMRESLYNAFDRIYIINLHGDNEKDSKDDENVFDIRVGVCISLFVKHSASGNHSADVGTFSRDIADLMSSSPLKSAKSHESNTANLRIPDSISTSLESKILSQDTKVCHTEGNARSISSGVSHAKDSCNTYSETKDTKETTSQDSKLYYFSTADNGIFKRTDKYNLLNEIAYKGLDFVQWQRLSPSEPYFWFVPRQLDNEEYEHFWALGSDKAFNDVKAIFEAVGSGNKAERDSVCIHFNTDILKQTLQDFITLDSESIRQKYSLKADSRDWSIDRAVADVKAHFSCISDSCSAETSLYYPDAAKASQKTSCYTEPSEVSHTHQSLCHAERSEVSYKNNKRYVANAQYDNNPRHIESSSCHTEGNARSISKHASQAAVLSESQKNHLDSNRDIFAFSKPQYDPIQKIAYRPFDTRYTFFSGKSKGFWGTPSAKISKHFLQGENLGISTTKLSHKLHYAYAFVVDKIADVNFSGQLANSDMIIPLYRYEATTGDNATHTQKIEKVPNFTHEFKAYCQSHEILKTKSLEQILYFIYANLYNPTYRKTYAEYLKIGFPRVNFDVEKSYFEKLESYGKALVNLHLMREIPADSINRDVSCASHTQHDNSCRPDSTPCHTEAIAEISHKDNRDVSPLAQHDNEASNCNGNKPIMLDFMANANSSNPSFVIKKLNAHARHIESTLILNDDLCITGISKAVYDYTIGGYKVIEKWLNYRTNYKCSKEELEHLVNMCKVIKATLTLEQELEKC